MNELHPPPEERPDFMVALSLLPPYSLEDIHKAYRARAREVHPDRGGATADFLKLQDFYERAQSYVKFQEGRQQWLATRVEPYIQQQEVVAEVERRGGHVEIESLDWMKRPFGDFSILAERLRRITLRDVPDGDAFLRYLAENSRQLPYLFDLDVAGSTINDADIQSLLALRGLARINLARTQVTEVGFRELAALPELRWLNVGGTSLTWWRRWQLRRQIPNVVVVVQ